MSYQDKWKDPRWQKVRLKVLEAANWECQACGGKEQTLAVHHLVYSTPEPWDSPMEELECLCKDCHEIREGFDIFVGQKSMIPTIVAIYVYNLMGEAIEKPELWANTKPNFIRLMEALIKARCQRVREWEAVKK